VVGAGAHGPAAAGRGGVACREAHRPRRDEGLGGAGSRPWLKVEKGGESVGCVSQGREIRQLCCGEEEIRLAFFSVGQYKDSQHRVER
jgi:hypothetical protein